MKMNGGFLITKIKQLGDRIFEKVLSENNVDAFNGAQGRILFVLWQGDGIPIKALSDRCGLAITSLTTMLDRMEKQGLITRTQDNSDKRKTLLILTDKARSLKTAYDAVSDKMGKYISIKDIIFFLVSSILIWRGGRNERLYQGPDPEYEFGNRMYRGL